MYAKFNDRCIGEIFEIFSILVILICVNLIINKIPKDFFQNYDKGFGFGNARYRNRKQTNRARVFALQVMKSINKNADIFFTDGSVINRNYYSGGASWYFAKNNQQEKEIASFSCEIKTKDSDIAEIKAIQMSLEFAKTLIVTNFGILLHFQNTLNFLLFQQISNRVIINNINF